MRLLSILFCLTALVVTASRLGAAEPGQAAVFPILDAMLYKNKPDLRRFGIMPIRIAYGSDLWNEGDSRRDVPSRKLVEKIVQERSPGNILVIDI